MQPAKQEPSGPQSPLFSGDRSPELPTVSITTHTVDLFGAETIEGIELENAKDTDNEYL